jgi:crotonobetainyl-CoA:carnitine CoA-transferase CaiB-like acyl-CoA transferase
LDMIHIGMRGDQRFAPRQGEVQLADQLDDLLDRIFVTDIDQNPLVAVEDQVHIAAQNMSRLVIYLDHVRKNGATLKHRGTREVPAAGAVLHVTKETLFSNTTPIVARETGFSTRTRQLAPNVCFAGIRSAWLCSGGVGDKFKWGLVLSV